MEGVEFPCKVNFEKAYFRSNLFFNLQGFMRGVVFNEAIMAGELVDFRGAIFGGNNSFEGAIFRSTETRFDRADVRGKCAFVKTKFLGDVYFDSTKIQSDINMIYVEFKRHSSFVNVKMCYPTTMDSVKFHLEPPDFNE